MIALKRLQSRGGVLQCTMLIHNTITMYYGKNICRVPKIHVNTIRFGVNSCRIT